MLLAVFSLAPASAPDEKSVASRSDRVYVQWLGSFGYMPGAGYLLTGSVRSIYIQTIMMTFRFIIYFK